MKHFITILLSSLVLFTATQGYAKEAEGWVLVSDKVVNYKSETDTVEPLAYVSERNFSKLKIKVVQGTVNLKELVVTMSDGSTKDLKSMGTLTKGMSTRAWTLPGDENAKFKKLDMTYDSWGSNTLSAVGLSKKAKIEVWGKKRTSEE
ncbi:hypothetical protein EJ063_14450 [Vibrio aquaticus]|uniref:DUF2541 family protein n=1 Tax=Vibrio aquaticus TaxID=2496559 RepID=A0A432CUC5_9VIBR|nr:hypothetical protein [Vibrio aquaticus]RTZ15040.1 hypothetical protein EJ063_14450 [Vibrio aquaticus]